MSAATRQALRHGHIWTRAYSWSRETLPDDLRKDFATWVADRWVGDTIMWEAINLAAEYEAWLDHDSALIAHCPACGNPIDYCLGHGEMGDPQGNFILTAHDEGYHLMCHPDGCPERRTA